VSPNILARPHLSLPARTIGVWAVRHGWISAGGLVAYDRLLSDNLTRLMPAIGFYLLFGLYWAYAGRDRAADKIPESAFSAVLHKLLVNLSVLLICIPLPGLTLRILPASTGFLILGLGVELGGVAIAVAARRALGRNWSREVRIAVDHELVRTGPYQRLRHPIYTGALAVSLGLAIVSGLLSAFVGFAILSLAYWRKIRLEEAILAKAFGSELDDYRRTSWALIPLLL
jgi:protein-S-isoprenylcysteine O-methyltransferase Ste14